MPTYRTKGIVIKYTDLRETDRIVTVFTTNLGKVQVVVKGARKTLSKLGCHLDLFSLAQLEIAEGRNLDTVIGVQAATSFPNIKKSLSKTSQVYYLVELIDQLIPDEYKDTRIFDLLVSTLKILDSDVCQDEVTESLLAQAFKIKLLQLIGFAPQLSKCGQCEQLVTPDGDYYFSNRLGSLRCQSCRGGQNEGVRLSPASLKIIRVLVRENIHFASKIKVDPKDLTLVEDILDNYIKYIIEKEPRSLRFVAKVKGLAKRP